MFSNFVPGHAEWNLDYLGKRLCDFVPKLSVAKDRSSIDNIFSGSSQHTSLLQHVLAALTPPLLEIGLEALWIVAVTVDKQVHWAEGCDCHAEVWTSYTSKQTKKRKFVEISGWHTTMCYMNGKRAVAMAWVEGEHMGRRIMYATDETGNMG